jgi:hypothetical protein
LDLRSHRRLYPDQRKLSNLKWTRRGMLVAIAAARLRADEAQDVWDLFTRLASALSAGDAADFMQPFDRSMKGYETLNANVKALLDENDVQSSIELVSDEASGTGRAIELDWLLQIVAKEDTATLVRRRELIESRVMKQRGKWRVTAFEPLGFLAPPGPK